MAGLARGRVGRFSGENRLFPRVVMPCITVVTTRSIHRPR
ncbi:hypothetical protein thalar_01676 [Litoreibacter arenae DSM 19593]|uniref:Uncharacterized protein n=1 Tax=Litoreibacter arenae DSM 19593 TaxID=1123360 RepID=S9QFX3_9RHOB|nr:hypothetical protein thalar_01676 [Litoreibacter arenae DSM 19593]